MMVGCCAHAAPSKPAKADPSTNAPASTEIEIPQSVFVIPANAREGRNPFFPHSAAVQPIHKPKQQVLDGSSLVLNGITSRPRPSVMINGITFEKGEEHELRVPGGGKLKVRCEDIRQDSAVVVVNGVEQRELHMRSGL